MSDGMRRELAYLSSHATNRYFIPNWGMKLKQNDSYLIGSAAEYKTVYVPFDNATGWEPGKRYIYTLIFGGGYDDQGEPILSPITFDAATADWADASADVNF